MYTYHAWGRGYSGESPSHIHGSLQLHPLLYPSAVFSSTVHYQLDELGALVDLELVPLSVTDYLRVVQCKMVAVVAVHE